jgi:alpha,alpha-trehalase
MDILHYLYEVTGDRQKAIEYGNMHAKFKYVHDEMFYNKTAGAWFDYNVRTSSHNLEIYPSIATPLFTDCYERLDDDKPKRLFQLLLDTGFLNYSGGVPTSLIQNTSQQWDFPNG